MKPLVYIAAPYTNPDPVINTRQAIKCGLWLWHEDVCAVVIPHLSMLAHLVDPMRLEEWYRFDLDLLEHCHAVWRLDGESTGADAEVLRAKELGLPVFGYHGAVDSEGYGRSLVELIEWCKAWTP